jgi:hypothetical protein
MQLKKLDGKGVHIVQEYAFEPHDTPEEQRGWYSILRVCRSWPQQLHLLSEPSKESHKGVK